MARERIAFQGLPARICWVGLGDRHRLGLAFNEMVRSGELKAPIVIGRDHLDSGSVASPNRETEAMKDGSDAVSDWPLLNALLNTASGATWVSLHHGGGVGMAAGEGAEIPLRFGAKSAPGTGRPIDGIVKVIKLVRNAEMRFGESIAPFGDAAHIRLRGIDIILNTTRAQSFDPSLFSAMDIDPGSKKILVIKSTNHFYASFSKIASEILYCSAGTPYPNDPAKTPYRRARRDIWPMIADPHA